MNVRDLAKKMTPAWLFDARRAWLARRQRQRMLDAMNLHARRLWLLSQVSYDHVRLPSEVENIRATIQRAAESIYGDQWNFYSDALDSPAIDYLEIGSCQGLSLSLIGALLDARGCRGRLVSVDPYFESGYVEGTTGPYAVPTQVRVDKTTRVCAESLYRKLALPVEVREQTSLDGLRGLLREGASFDLIYIDGSHEQLWPAVDFGQSYALLKPHGIIILDDHLWPDVQPLKLLYDQHAEKIQETWKTASYRFG